MKRHLVFVGCLLVALVLPSQAHNRGARKTARKIVIVPSVGTANTYKEGDGPEEAVYKSVKDHLTATQFKIVWASAVFNTNIHGAAIYNRSKKTVHVYDSEQGSDMLVRTHNIFLNVDDATLKRLATHPLYKSPDSDFDNLASSYFDGLKDLGCSRRTILHYKYYRSQSHH